MKTYVLTLALSASALTSGSVFAQSQGPVQIPNGVITSIEAIPLSGGFNPAFAGVLLRGTIKAGGNACEAQQYTASIQMLTEGDITTFVPVLERKEGASDIACILTYDANFKGLSFSQSFNLDKDLVPYAFIQDVYELGHAVTVGELTVDPK